ncbi:MAG TPA: DUF4388 domain-containing protein [Anaerolineae bacterium]|nr:DUF4388 domain-containing protein [Anaerolineae bacterium]
MLRGSLQDVRIERLIHQARQQPGTACLTLKSGARQASLFFKNGDVIHATLGNIEGMVVIYAVMPWKNGEYSLELNVETPVQTIPPGWTALFIQGARLAKEEAGRVEPTPLMPGSNEQMAGLVQDFEKIFAGLEAEFENFIAAAVVSLDGLTIAQHTRSHQTNMENISAQIALFIKLVETSITKLSSGSMEDNLLTTQQAFILIRTIHGTPYCLSIATEREQTLLGHLRLISQLYTERVAKTISFNGRTLKQHTNDPDSRVRQQSPQ